MATTKKKELTIEEFKTLAYEIGKAMELALAV